MSHELCATNIHRRFFVTLAHACSPFERGRYTLLLPLDRRHQVIEVMSAITTPARKSRVVIDTTRALRHATR